MIGQKGIIPAFGGIERHVQELSMKLEKSGHEVTVYARSWYTQKQENKYQGVKIKSIWSLTTKNFDAITYTFLATIDAMRHDFDIIHYHGVGPALLSWMPRIFQPNTKVIVTFHGRDSLHTKWGVFARIMLHCGEWCAVTFPHRTIVVSRTLKRYCSQYFHRATNFIPNGFSTAIYQQQNASHNISILSKFGIRPRFYILTVARLTPHKRIHHLIQAFQKLPTSDLKLVIIGDDYFVPKYASSLKKLAATNPNILFLGMVNEIDLAILYRHAIFFVLPSETEGLPIVMLESFCSGTAVLGSDIPPHTEIINNPRFLFKNKNAESLRQKMLYLIQHPLEVRKYASDMQKMVVEKYDWDMIVEQTIKIYRQ